MSESSKYRNIAKDTHYLAQLICDSPGGHMMMCSHLKHFRRANEVLADALASGLATQSVFDYEVPEGSCLLVLAAYIRSDASQADFPADNEVLRSDSDPSPAIGPCLELAQWQANGNNKTPIMPWLALINSSYLLVFNAGERAQLLVNANITAGQRVNLIVCVEGFLVPSRFGPLYNEFQSQFMVENPCAVCGTAISQTNIDLSVLSSDPPEGTSFGDVGGGDVVIDSANSLLYISIGSTLGLGNRRMQIWDITTALTPLNTANVLDVPIRPGDPASPVFVDFANDRLYTNSSLDNLRIVIYDISVRTAPVVLGTLVTGFAFSGANSDLVIDSALNLAFAVYQSNGRLESYDISVPAAPILIQTLIILSGPASIALAGTLAYVVSSFAASGLRIYDISNPAAMALVSTLAIPTAAVLIFNADIVIVGTNAYIVLGENFTIVDITNPLAPTITSQTVTGTSATRVLVSGTTALVLDRNDQTVTVLNVFNPASPVICNVINLAALGGAFGLDGNNLWVAERFTGAVNDTLEVFDISGCVC